MTNVNRASRGALVGILLLAACAAPSASPSGGLPPRSTQADSPMGWEKEWAELIEAAKREGSVKLIGPTGADRRDSLTVPFEQKYGITVDYWAEPGAGIPPKVTAEREAGQYLWDVVIAGALEVLVLPLGVAQPIEPHLILPDVKDKTRWRGGDFEFLDANRQILVMDSFHRGTLFINSTLVGPDEIKSHRDLLNPKWRGRLLSDDPRFNGPGQSTFLFFYSHPELGPDFIRALARQDVTFLRNYAQEVDQVGQGRYPILIGASDSLVEERIKQGIPISIVDPRQLKEGTDVGAASGMVALFDRPNNPNAAKLYINWLLSKEGQTSFAQGASYISNRVDVAFDHAAPWRVPQPGAFKTYGLEPRETIRTKVLPLVEEIFGR